MSGINTVTGEEPSLPPVGATNRVYYTCRRCRSKLFTAADVVPHDPVDGAKKSFKYRRGGPLVDSKATEGATVPAAELCTSYFLDPDASPWVAEDIREANAAGAVVEPDTIYCPNARCRAKLGTQSWTGSQCSCGTWVTPAFRIHARAVDKMTEHDTSS
jgi:dual specificity phosphatase 12